MNMTNRPIVDSDLYREIGKLAEDRDPTTAEIAGLRSDIADLSNQIQDA